MVTIIGGFREARGNERLLAEAGTEGLSYLAYLRVPTSGLEGFLVEVGGPCPGPRQVAILNNPAGRAELHWPADSTYTAPQATALLKELEQAERATLGGRLHDTICQSLTAAHLHLELGLMTRPEAGEEFTLAHQLVHEATVSVRELIDELAGGDK